MPCCLVLALAAVGCGDDDGVVPPADGGTGRMDGSSGGGDGSVPFDGTMPPADGGGGVPADADLDTGGPIVVMDGGIVITEDGGGTWTCHVTACEGHVLDCGNCTDDDADGLIDSHDPECLGPCDNTEGPALTSDVGGETGGPCKADCYFDFGNGSGGGDCVWDHRCDPLSVAPHYDPEGMLCAFEMSRVGTRDCPDPQPDNCLPHCRPLTPNGCDCFGCCTFDALRGRAPSEGGEFIWIGSVFEDTNMGSCTLDAITDRTLCRPCTPVEECYNDCGACELCLGRTTLPPECYPPPPSDGGTTPWDGGTPPWDGGSPWDGGTPPPRCDPGVQPCGLPGDPECPALYYCVTGCCQSIII